MRVLASISLIMMLIALPEALAQDGQPPANAEQTPAADKQAESDTDKKTDVDEKSNNKPPKKVFKPSEEISEDSPVPFPIDI